MITVLYVKTSHMYKEIHYITYSLELFIGQRNYFIKVFLTGMIVLKLQLQFKWKYLSYINE